MREERILYRDLACNLEHEVLLACKVKLMKLLVKLILLEVTILLGVLLGVGHRKRVILRSHLKNDLHLALIVEPLERVYCRCIVSMYILERYLKVADILKSLDSNALAILSVLLELYWFLDALYVEINQTCDADWKDTEPSIIDYASRIALIFS